MHKRQEGADVKTCYDFGNDPMRMMCFEHKTGLTVDRKK
jgi:hypothetical protein